MRQSKHPSIIALAFTSFIGCTQASDLGQDMPYIPPGTTPPAGTDAGAPGPATPPPTGTPNPTPNPAPTPVPGTDGGVVAAPDGGDTVPPAPGSAVEAIAGSGANCSTYGLPANGKCGGIYCGIDEALLGRAFAELPQTRTCVVPEAVVCSGLTARTVSSCARSVKSNPFNLGKPNAELRPLIQDCVYMEAPTLQNVVVPTCLSCYIDSAECSGDNCLDQCLLGDSPECDKCRLDKGCSLPVATCTGFPNPL